MCSVNVWINFENEFFFFRKNVGESLSNRKILRVPEKGNKF